MPSRSLRARLAACTAPLALAAAGHGLAAQKPAARAPATQARAAQPPAWLRGTTCYEIFVRSFADADGDGIGDLRGLEAKLDHLNDGDPRTRSDLGVRCLWLMPVTTATGYHGYDPVDHYTIAREYGTNADFNRLVRAAHARGIRVIVDMVLNHVSSDYPGFQAALRDTASPYRQWFRFAPQPGPVNPWGGMNWHRSPVRDEWYYGFFWKGMPDLDYTRSPAPLAEMRTVASYWLREMGVDGFRLDAVKYLVEEGTRLDDTPGTHRVLAEWQAHVKRVKPSAWNVGEVYDSTAALLPYYPRQLDAYFAFEVSDSILAAVRRGDGRGMLAPFVRLQDSVPWWRIAPFLRNHDQPRTRTVLGGDLARARLAAAILFTIPGVPFVYYGEELGMQGDKPDERLRTPMPWRTDAPHAGFTTGTPWQRLQDDSLTANVAAQANDPSSMLAWYRELVRLRLAAPVLASGRLVPLTTARPDLAAWLVVEGDDAVYVVANLGTSDTTEVTAIESPPGLLRPGAVAERDLLTAAVRHGTVIPADGALRLRVALPPSRSVRVVRLVRR